MRIGLTQALPAGKPTLPFPYSWTDGQSETELTCRACGCSGHMERIIHVAETVFGQPTVFHRCPNCECLLPHPFSSVEDINEIRFNPSPHFAKYAVEIDAGIDFMTAPLQCLPQFGRPPRMLDIGCGFGFSMLYAKLMFGATAVGYEPMGYGDAGREILGLDIKKTYFNGTDEKYDIVYSSEVIELVESPARFFAALSGAVTDDGYLILATPNAERIDSSLGVVEAIKNGEHNHVLSPQACSLLLARNGFAHSEIMSLGHRLIVIASKSKPIDVKRYHDRTMYRDFLKKICETYTRADYFANGMSFRLFKELVNAGDFAAAAQALDGYLSNVGRRYGDWERCGAAMLKALPEEKAREKGDGHTYKPSFWDIAGVAPFNLPVFHFYYGMYVLNAMHDLEKAAGHLEQAFELCVRIASFAPDFEYAAAIWPAKFHEGIARARRGDSARARKCFEQVVAHNETNAGAFNWAPDPAILRRARRELEALSAARPSGAIVPKPEALSAARPSGAIVPEPEARLQAADQVIRKLIGRDLFLPELAQMRRDERLPDSLAGPLAEGLRQIAQALLGARDSIAQDRQALRAAAKSTLAQVDDALDMFQRASNAQEFRIQRAREDIYGLIAALKPRFAGFVQLLDDARHFATVSKPFLSALFRVCDAQFRMITYAWQVLRHPIRGWRAVPYDRLPGYSADQPGHFSFWPLSPVTLPLTLPNRPVDGLAIHIGKAAGRPACGLNVDLLGAQGQLLAHGDIPPYRLKLGAWNFVHLDMPAQVQGGETLLRLSPAGSGRPPALGASRLPLARTMRLGSRLVLGAACDVCFPSAKDGSMRRDLLIITPDTLGAARVGLGMRHWEIARALGRLNFKVTLASCLKREDGLEGDRFELAPYSRETLPDLIAGHRAVMTQGAGVFHVPEDAFSGQDFIVDMITPIHMENIAVSAASYDEGYECAREGLRRGDFFVCGNERQRLYWLGILAGLGRTGRSEFERDREFRSLIDLVPFGIRETPPEATARGLRNWTTGFKGEDFILLWFGGIWDWLDPLPFIRAAAKARKANPAIKVYFSMFSQKDRPPTAAAVKARSEARRLGILGEGVYFRPEPAPFDRRANYLLDADMGVFFQTPGMETTLSARTRVYDYIWAGLPVLMTGGDETAETLKSRECGVILDAYDEDSLAGALLAYSLDAKKQREARENVKRLGQDLHWVRQVEPLARFLENRGKSVMKGQTNG